MADHLLNGLMAAQSAAPKPARGASDRSAAPHDETFARAFRAADDLPAEPDAERTDPPEVPPGHPEGAREESGGDGAPTDGEIAAASDPRPGEAPRHTRDAPDTAAPARTGPEAAARAPLAEAANAHAPSAAASAASEPGRDGARGMAQGWLRMSEGIPHAATRREASTPAPAPQDATLSPSPRDAPAMPSTGPEGPRPRVAAEDPAREAPARASRDAQAEYPAPRVPPERGAMARDAAAQRPTPPVPETPAGTAEDRMPRADRPRAETRAESPATTATTATPATTAPADIREVPRTGADTAPRVGAIAQPAPDARLPDRGRDDAEQGTGPARAEPSGGLRGASEAAALQRSDMADTTRTTQTARAIASQISAGALRGGERPVEIALSPEELGRVRLSLAGTGEAGISVTVQAERSDTLELMRRHAGELEEAFRALGYDMVTFDFGARDDGSGRRDRPADARNAPHPDAQTQPPATATHRDTGSEGGLDLRL